MKRIWIKSIHTVLLSLLITSCSAGLGEQEDSQAGPVEVGLFAGGVQTRTEMQQNGLSAIWSDGDKLAVWAVGSGGEYILSNQVFEAYGLDEKRGYFTSVLSSPMPEISELWHLRWVVARDKAMKHPSAHTGQVAKPTPLLPLLYL